MEIMSCVFLPIYLIVFSDSNGLRHCRIFGAGKNNTIKALGLLGWNDHHHWGDKYRVSIKPTGYDAYYLRVVESRETPSVIEKDRTNSLYYWLDEVMTKGEIHDDGS